MDKPTARFIARIAENLPDMSGAAMQDWINDPEELQRFLFGLRSKSAKVTLVQKENAGVVFETKKSSQLDFLVAIDRLSVRVSYPRGKKRLVNPELEYVGPKEYDLKKEVEQWSHPKQKEGVVAGKEIYDFLKKNDTLIRCLGLTDLLAIKAKGAEIFHELFRGLAVYGWRSVIEDRFGRMYVPCLLWIGDMVALDWRILDDKLGSGSPALIFKK